MLFLGSKLYSRFWFYSEENRKFSQCLQSVAWPGSMITLRLPATPIRSDHPSHMGFLAILFFVILDLPLSRAFPSSSCSFCLQHFCIWFTHPLDYFQVETGVPLNKSVHPLLLVSITCIYSSILSTLLISHICVSYPFCLSRTQSVEGPLVDCCVLTA